MSAEVNGREYHGDCRIALGALLVVVLLLGHQPVPYEDEK